MPEICRAGNVRGRLKAAVTNAEKIKLNKEIKTEIYQLTELGGVQDD